MNKLRTCFMLCLLMGTNLSAQVAINNDGSTPHSSAMLDVKSVTSGLLIPRMTAAQRDAIGSPAQGLMVFVTDDSTFYFYKNSSWEKVGRGATGWHLSSTNIYADSLHSVVIGSNATTGVFEVVTDSATNSFTADRCNGGTASAQEEAAGYPASNAFDDATSTSWRNNGTLPVWLGYDFGDGNGQVVARYRMHWQGANTDFSPTAWIFQASGDGTTWTDLDTQIGQSWVSGEWKTFTFTNTVRYRYYRLKITDNQGSLDGNVSLSEVEMMERIYDDYPSLFVGDGKVGIGTRSPGAALEVNGSMKLTDGTEGSGRILVSDASGNARWADGDTVSAGGWTVSGNYIYSAGDSVGIGTATPVAELDVQGRIAQTGTGKSVFIGEGAGVNDDLSDNKNVFVGYKAGESNTLGTSNTANGAHALQSNTVGYSNTAYGFRALQNNTGQSNTATGANALSYNINGSYNTANGTDALENNTFGGSNTATGHSALILNTTGASNTANGRSALFNNITGSYNTATGYRALYKNTTGFANVAVGAKSLYSNTERSCLVAVGDSALFDNGLLATSGSQAKENTAIGSKALRFNDKGSDNTAVGYRSLYANTVANFNTAMGHSGLYNNTTASRNTAVGNNALYSQSYDNGGTEWNSDNVAVGNDALRYNQPTATTNGVGNTAVGSKGLMNNTTGWYNSALGYEALTNNTTASNNIAFGANALFTQSYNNGGVEWNSFNVAVGTNALYSNQPTSQVNGVQNTAVGHSGLYSNTVGKDNSALGYLSLYSNTTASRNTAVGNNALYSQSYDNGGTEWNSDNVAVGNDALRYNQPTATTNGIGNTAVGSKGLMNNTTGWYNSALGYEALTNNTTAGQNIAIGTFALRDQSYDNGGSVWNSDNVAIGYSALLSNQPTSATTGYRNSAIGSEALYSNTTGYKNTAVGYHALYNNTTGNTNTAVGNGAFTLGSSWSNSAAFGFNAEPNADNKIKIGNSSVTWIGGQVTWTAVSDERAKKNIREDVKGLDFILKLRPVTYYFDKDKMDDLIGVKDESDYPAKYEIETIKQSGFLAQEVEAASQQAGYDFSGVKKPKGGSDYYGLSYAEFVVPLVKAVQEQQEMIEQQQQTMEKQQQTIELLKKEIEVLKRLMSGDL